jgi:hypothetical protein
MAKRSGTKRELIDTGTDKRFAHRDGRGHKEAPAEVQRSVGADRPREKSRLAPSGAAATMGMADPEHPGTVACLDGGNSARPSKNPSRPTWDLIACRDSLQQLRAEIVLLRESSNSFADLAERLAAQVALLRQELASRATFGPGDLLNRTHPDKRK